MADLTDPDVAKYLAKLSHAELFEQLLSAMARFVFRKAGEPIDQLRRELVEARAEIAALQIRLDTLESGR